MLQENKQSILNRLKTVRGHLDGILRMVEEEAYCVELMKKYPLCRLLRSERTA